MHAQCKLTASRNFGDDDALHSFGKALLHYAIYPRIVSISEKAPTEKSIFHLQNSILIIFDLVD